MSQEDAHIPDAGGGGEAGVGSPVMEATADEGDRSTEEHFSSSSAASSSLQSDSADEEATPVVPPAPSSTAAPFDGTERRSQVPEVQLSSASSSPRLTTTTSWDVSSPSPDPLLLQLLGSHQPSERKTEGNDGSHLASASSISSVLSHSAHTAPSPHLSTAPLLNYFAEAGEEEPEPPVFNDRGEREAEVDGPTAGRSDSSVSEASCSFTLQHMSQSQSMDAHAAPLSIPSSPEEASGLNAPGPGPALLSTPTRATSYGPIPSPLHSYFSAPEQSSSSAVGAPTAVPPLSLQGSSPSLLHSTPQSMKQRLAAGLKQKWSALKEKTKGKLAATHEMTQPLSHAASFSRAADSSAVPSAVSSPSSSSISSHQLHSSPSLSPSTSSSSLLRRGDGVDASHPTPPPSTPLKLQQKEIERLAKERAQQEKQRIKEAERAAKEERRQQEKAQKEAAKLAEQQRKAEERKQQELVDAQKKAAAREVELQKARKKQMKAMLDSFSQASTSSSSNRIPPASPSPTADGRDSLARRHSFPSAATSSAPQSEQIEMLNMDARSSTALSSPSSPLLAASSSPTTSPSSPSATGPLPSLPSPIGHLRIHIQQGRFINGLEDNPKQKTYVELLFGGRTFRSEVVQGSNPWYDLLLDTPVFDLDHDVVLQFFFKHTLKKNECFGMVVVPLGTVVKEGMRKERQAAREQRAATAATLPVTSPLAASSVAAKPSPLSQLHTLFSSLFTTVPRRYHFLHWLHIYPSTYEKAGTLWLHRFPAAEDGMLQSGMSLPKKDLGFIRVAMDLHLEQSLAHDYMQVDPTQFYIDPNKQMMAPNTAIPPALSPPSLASASAQPSPALPQLIRPEEPLDFTRVVFKKNVRRLRRLLTLPAWYPYLLSLFTWRNPLLSFYSLMLWTHICLWMPAWQYPLCILFLLLGIQLLARRWQLTAPQVSLSLMHTYEEDALPYEHAGEGHWRKFKRYRGHLAKTSFYIGRISTAMEKLCNLLNFQDVALSVFTYGVLLILATMLSAMLYFIPWHKLIWLMGVALYVRGAWRTAMECLQSKQPQLWQALVGKNGTTDGQPHVAPSPGSDASLSSPSPPPPSPVSFWLRAIRFVRSYPSLLARLLRAFVSFVRGLLRSLRHLYARSPDYYEVAHRVLCERAVEDELISHRQRRREQQRGQQLLQQQTLSPPPVQAQQAEASSAHARRLLFGSMARTTSGGATPVEGAATTVAPPTAPTATGAPPSSSVRTSGLPPRPSAVPSPAASPPRLSSEERLQSFSPLLASRHSACPPSPLAAFAAAKAATTSPAPPSLSAPPLAIATPPPLSLTSSHSSPPSARIPPPSHSSGEEDSEAEHASRLTGLTPPTSTASLPAPPPPPPPPSAVSGHGMRRRSLTATDRRDSSDSTQSAAALWDELDARPPTIKWYS